jgi:hypothetical protein
MVAEPVLVVEVLSPSTSQVDRWRKVADYRTMASVREILVLFSDERRVEIVYSILVRSPHLCVSSCLMEVFSAMYPLLTRSLMRLLSVDRVSLSSCASSALEVDL